LEKRLEKDVATQLFLELQQVRIAQTTSVHERTQYVLEEVAEEKAELNKMEAITEHMQERARAICHHESSECISEAKYEKCLSELSVLRGAITSAHRHGWNCCRTCEARKSTLRAQVAKSKRLNTEFTDVGNHETEVLLNIKMKEQMTVHTRVQEEDLRLAMQNATASQPGAGISWYQRLEKASNVGNDWYEWGEQLGTTNEELREKVWKLTGAGQQKRETLQFTEAQLDQLRAMQDKRPLQAQEEAHQYRSESMHAVNKARLAMQEMEQRFRAEHDSQSAIRESLQEEQQTWCLWI